MLVIGVIGTAHDENGSLLPFRRLEIGLADETRPWWAVGSVIDSLLTGIVFGRFGSLPRELKDDE